VPDTHLKRFWLLMTAKYDEEWIRKTPTDEMLKITQEEWGVELYKIGSDLIRRGLDKCTDVYPAWPASIGELNLLCKPDPGKHLAKDQPLRRASAAISFLSNYSNDYDISRGGISSRDGIIRAVPAGEDGIKIMVPSSKAKGGS
jgi:hypothetical protein